MQKKLRNKTMLRLLLSLVAMFILPMVVLYYLYTSQIVTTVAEEARKIIANDLQAAIRLIDSNIETLDNTITMFQRASGYQSYLTYGFSYDESGNSATPALLSDIPYIYFLNDADDDFFLLIPEVDTVFSASGMSRSEHYFRKYYYDPEGKGDAISQIRSATTMTVRSDENLTTHKGTGRTLSFIYPLTKNTRGFGGTAVFCVQAQRFSEFFKPRSQDFNTSTLVFDEEGSFLFSQNADEEMIQELSAAFGTLQDSYTSENSRQEYIVIRGSSDFNSWQYITLVPDNNDLYRNTFQINHFFHIYMLLTIVLGLFLLTGFLWLNYKPIFTLREKAKNMLPVDVPNTHSGDDLDTIYRTLDVLKDRNASLRNSVSQSIREIQAARLHRLLTNYYDSIEQFNVDCEQIGLSFHEDRFYVSVVQLATRLEYNEELQAMILQEFPPEIETKCLYLPNQSRFVMIHAPQEAGIDTEPFYSVLGLLHDRLNCLATIGIGRLHPGTSTISKSYMQASAALDYQVVKGSDTVITYDEAMIHDADSYQYPIQDLRRLSNALTAGNITERNKIWETLLGRIKAPQTSLMNARCIGFDMIKALMSIQELHQEVAYWLPEALTQLCQEKDKQNIVSIIEKTWSMLLSTDQTHSKKQTNPLIDEILSYIQQNYCRGDFSIQEIAEHFEILPSNISNYFKEQTGYGLLEYLIDLRIRQAKELLHSTDMTVNDISMSVGYYNASSFIRRFKQHEGVTPNEYRFKC